MNFKKVLITVSAALILFSGCGKKTILNQVKLSEKKQKTVTIGFSIDTLAIERWRRDLDVFIATAKDAGADVIVQNAGNSSQEQIRQIQYLIGKNVDALVVLPKSADSLSDVIKSAKAKNIPVISYDRLILNAPLDLYLSIDSGKVGELMASEMLKKVPYGTVYCIYGSEDDYNMTLIKNNVEKTLQGSMLRIGHVFYTANWNYDLSYNEMYRLLQEKKIPNAVICGNDAIANSVIQAVSEVAPESKIYIVGQDADILNCQHIVYGKQTSTIYKPITELSRQAALWAVKLGSGKEGEDISPINGEYNNGYTKIPALLLEPQTVTKDNLEEIIINSGFHTKEEVYRK